MEKWQYPDMLNLLKALADEQRLMMVALMSHAEWTGTALAGELGISEPTVSHHLSKLRAAGLLTLRMAGNHRYYRVNPKRLAQFKAYVNEIDVKPAAPVVRVVDNSWIEALDWDEKSKKILRDYTEDGRLIQHPVRSRTKWLVVLRWLASLFEPERRYTEKEVNAMLLRVDEDYATLRRNLVDFGFMRRERGGGDYWLTPDDENQPG